MNILKSLLKSKWGIAILVFIAGGFYGLFGLLGISIGADKALEAQKSLTEAYHSLGAPVLVAPSGTIIITPTAPVSPTK